MLTTWSMEGVAPRGEGRSISSEIVWVEEKKASGPIPLFCLVRIASTAGIMPWFDGREGRRAKYHRSQNKHSVYTTALLAANVKFYDLAARLSFKVTQSLVPTDVANISSARDQTILGFRFRVRPSSQPLSHKDNSLVHLTDPSTTPGAPFHCPWAGRSGRYDEAPS